MSSPPYSLPFARTRGTKSRTNITLAPVQPRGTPRSEPSGSSLLRPHRGRKKFASKCRLRSSRDLRRRRSHGRPLKPLKRAQSDVPHACIISPSLPASAPTQRCRPWRTVDDPCPMPHSPDCSFPRSAVRQRWKSLDIITAIVAVIFMNVRHE